MWTGSQTALRFEFLISEANFPSRKMDLHLFPRAQSPNCFEPTQKHPHSHFMCVEEIKRERKKERKKESPRTESKRTEKY